MKVTNMKVTSMINSKGNPVPNQFIIYADKKVYFQSYATIIVEKDIFLGQTTLDENSWDYSVTTGRYRNIFLGETKKETQKKINLGVYKLKNLNK